MLSGFYQLLSMLKGQKFWLVVMLVLGSLFLYGELMGIRLFGSVTTYSSRPHGTVIHNGINHK